MEEINKQGFNPNEHLMQLKNKNGFTDYLEVKWRLVWFRDQCPQGTIETELVHLDLDRDTEEEGWAWNAETRKNERVMKHAKGFAIFRAIVKDGKGGSATGTKSEKAASFGDFIEKAESGAIGRALAALGYGTQFTGDELNEQHRIVDSPVESVKANGNNMAHASSIKEKATPASSQGQEKPLHIRLYEEGKRAELWNKETYYPELGKIVGCPMRKEVFYGLKPEDLAKIERYVAAAVDAAAH